MPQVWDALSGSSPRSSPTRGRSSGQGRSRPRHRGVTSGACLTATSRRAGGRPWLDQPDRCEHGIGLGSHDGPPAMSARLISGGGSREHGQTADDSTAGGDAASRCAHAPRWPSDGRPRTEKLYSAKSDQPSAHRLRHPMTPPVKPGTHEPQGPSRLEPTPVRVGSDTAPPRSSVHLEDVVTKGNAIPRRPFASVRGLLTRLAQGRRLLSRPVRDAEFDAAERRAYLSALELESGAPLAPASREPRSIGVSTADPSTAAPTPHVRMPTGEGQHTMRPKAPNAARTAAPTPTLSTRSVASDSATYTVAAAIERTAVWVSAPRADAKPAVPADGGPEGGSPAPPRRHQPGDTAPDSLLQAPTSVVAVADDFFDGLVRQIEGDR